MESSMRLWLRRRWPLAVLSIGLLTLVLLPLRSPASAAATRYEAENATISQGVVESNHLNFSGTGFVNYDNLVGSYVEWTVTAAEAGTARLALRHSNGSTANRPMDITVNGMLVADELAFNPTGSWDTWADVTITATLAAGANTVRATATTANGGPNLDRLRVSAASGDIQPPTAPTNLRSTGVTSSSVSLAWDAATDNVGVTGYDVYTGGTLTKTVTGTSTTVTGLAPSTSYTFTVKARDAAGNASPASNAATATTSGATGPGMAVAPYEYFGWGSPPSPTSVMSATGVKWFTLAFMLSDGTCNPKWDGSRPLTGGDDQNKINAIRAAGGDVIVSFGGWSGNK